MAWHDEVVTPEYHLGRAKEAVKKARALPAGVNHNWYEIGYIHCELAIRALGDKASDALKKAADDIDKNSVADSSVVDLINAIDAARGK